jgi:hypothetical protein
MSMLPKFIAAFAVCLGLVSHSSQAADPMPELAKLDRSLRKEPTYGAKQPLYGLAVFGPKAHKRVWLVLDKSAPDAKDYDVLHIDLNANGDLTEPGKRLMRTDGDGEFVAGDFTDPATGTKHTEFKVRVSENEGDRSVMLSLRWGGEVKFGGGYPEDPETGYLKFATTREAAPVVWVNGDTPFRFQRWYGSKLTIGGKDDLKVFLGQPGRGPNTFFAAQVHFLPEDEWVRATLIYKDGMNKEQRVVSELKERC